MSPQYVALPWVGIADRRGTDDLLRWRPLPARSLGAFGIDSVDKQLATGARQPSGMGDERRVRHRSARKAAGGSPQSRVTSRVRCDWSA